jgi:hypothetical protein
MQGKRGVGEGVELTVEVRLRATTTPTTPLEQYATVVKGKSSKKGERRRGRIIRCRGDDGSPAPPLPLPPNLFPKSRTDPRSRVTLCAPLEDATSPITESREIVQHAAGEP